MQGPALSRHSRRFEQALGELGRLQPQRCSGEVRAAHGLAVEVAGLAGHLAIGDRCRIATRQGGSILAEVVGVRADHSLLMPYGTLDGVGLGCAVLRQDQGPLLAPGPAWLGRVVDALGAPADGRGPLPIDGPPRSLRPCPPAPFARRRLGPPLELGLRALDTLLTLCRGQRLGIFAGSGVGKSTLLGTIARQTAAEIVVIGLIGERGREVQEFIAGALGPEGLARSVLVVSTAGESPLLRRQAAQLTLTVAEAFRDQGRQVLCLFDSITRLAMAEREIGLAAGEPPTAKGYTPSVFTSLARLLERAGPGAGPQGDITALFTVLVDGDDLSEPIADAVRGILDGHIVLARAIAERGRFPAIDVLRSVSRAMPGCHGPAEADLARRARRLLATHDGMAELIRIGAYRQGSDPEIDQAIAHIGRLEAFLAQGRDEPSTLAQSFARLAECLPAAAT